MDQDIKFRFDKIDNKHNDLLSAISSIREVCAGCQAQIGMHAGRLAALDDLRDGAVPKLQQNVSSLKTKVAIYAGMASAVATAMVFAVIQTVKSFFVK